MTLKIKGNFTKNEILQIALDDRLSPQQKQKILNGNEKQVAHARKQLGNQQPQQSAKNKPQRKLTKQDLKVLDPVHIDPKLKDQYKTPYDTEKRSMIVGNI